MPELTKRVIDALKPAANDDVFAWVSDLKGSGPRPSPRTARCTTRSSGRSTT
jgi:hypothetical protein